ncbi:MAG: hypothetical protein ACR2ND_08055 [Solirubrobacteraceae bacterium]
MRRAILLLMSGAALLVLGGCASPTHSANGITAGDLRLTRQFGDFTIYWVGKRFQNVRLTAADSEIDYEPAIGMRMYYGDCEKQSSPLSTVGCRLPLEINTVAYKAHSNNGLGPHRNTTLRGVPAVIFDSGRSIELYTGRDFAIDIYADSPERALAAAAALKPANASRPFAAQLPAPTFKPGAKSDPQTEALARALRAPRPGILRQKHG